MSDKCAKEKAAVDAIQLKIKELHDEVSESTGAQKQGFARLLHQAEQDALVLQRKLNLCLAK